MSKILYRLVHLAIIFTAVSAIIFTSGCVMQERQQEPQDAAKNYKNTLKQWTRSQKVYRELETSFIVYCTYKSTHFRKAYVDYYAYVYKAAPEEQDKMLEGQEQLAGKYIDFIVALYTPDPKHNILYPSSSTWKVYLNNNLNERIKPSEISPIKSTPLMQNFYPYVNTWTKIYRVRFMIETGDEEKQRFLREEVNRIELMITGVLGEASFAWDISAEDY